MATRKHSFFVAVSVGLALTLTACGSGGSSAVGGESQSPSSSASAGPIKLTFWGKTAGQKAQVDLWNKENPNTQVTYAEQGGDADITQAIQNAVAAKNAPDLFEMPRGQATSFLVGGVTQDVSAWVNNDDGAFAEGAFDWVQVGDVSVGIPYGTNPTFNAINGKIFQSFGFEAPTTWDETIDQAITMNQQQNIKSFNFPGEDVSYLRDVASQNGAEWWQADGEAWKVGFTSPESLEAGAVIQKIIDNDLDSNYTYIEWDALMQYFSSGQLSQFTTSTWQLPVYEENFATSVGDWELASYPAWSDPATLVSPSYYNAYGVTSTSANPEAAATFARWLATDADAVAILASTDNAATFPVVADPSPYIEGLLPKNLLGDTKAQAPAVIERAAETSRSMKDGPNQIPAMEEMTAWWARALNKEVTIQQVLEHMQEWTVADLKSKNIAVAG